MKRSKFLFVLMFFLGFFLHVNAQNGEEQTRKTEVFKVNIKEMIAPPVWRMVKKSFDKATELNSDIILIHMNTYGGMVDYADSIRTLILQYPKPVFVFIDNNAASAGALISIACDSIYMRMGANIGAASVVNQSGEVMPDKYQSYMRSTMRSTAETNGRDPKIAEAMVDPSIVVPGVVDSGKVLTFTATEAMQWGFCEGIAESIDEVMHLAGNPEYNITEYQPTVIDKIIGWLINPVISGILILIIVGGIYFELQTPGVGFPIAASILAAILYFAPLYLEGLADNWEILIFIIGLLLIAVEVFVIPGFGVAGISGIILVIFGLTFSMLENDGFDFSFVGYAAVLRSMGLVIVTLFLAIIGSIALGARWLNKGGLLSKAVLSSEQKREEGFVGGGQGLKELIGKQGVVEAVLRPSGKVLIDGEVYDATSERSYLEKGEHVVVFKVEANQLFVRKV
ncbi:MAG: NfeD family protein [Flavobacteriales bacterium]